MTSSPAVPEWTGVALSSILVARAAVIAWRQHRGLGREIRIASAPTGVTLARMVAEARAGRAAIEARLSLGLSATAAFAPHRRDLLRTALIPTLDATKVVGLISLPGAMTGLILAGVSPEVAIRYQI